MPRGFVWWGVFLMVLAVPVTVQAQGFPGSLMGKVGAGEGYLGKGMFRLSGDAAFTYETIDLGFDAHGSGLDGIANIRHNYTFGGIALGITAAALVPQGFGVMANATVLAVSTSRDEERYNVSGAGPPRRRFWKTNNDTYSLEGAGLVRAYGGTYLLGGFRWDHLETTFSRPDSAVNLASLPSDEGLLVVNAYQPYAGAVIDQGGPYRRLRVGVIGWPQMYGSLEYGETTVPGRPVLLFVSRTGARRFRKDISGKCSENTAAGSQPW